MDKSRVCVNRTINLAKKKKCPKTNLLVYEKSKTPPNPHKPPCPPPTHIPRIAAIPAKRIRVCTGAELKKICPPKLCDCGPRKTFGFIHTLLKLLGLGVKCVIAGGIVYLTWDAGIWSNSDRTAELYSNVCNAFFPIFCPEDMLQKEKKPVSQECELVQELMCVPPPPEPLCCDKMPVDHEKAGNKVKDTWNCLVQCTFNAITGFPQNAIELLKSIKAAIDENSKTKGGEPKKKEECKPKGKNKKEKNEEEEKKDEKKDSHEG